MDLSRQERGYGADWERARKVVLVEEPTCRECGRAPSTHVDHIVPKSEGGSDERGNLQGLCAACHRRKSAREGNRSYKRDRRQGAA